MKNWTVADAVATIKAGKDAAGIKEITTHFPEFAIAVAKNDLAAVAAMMPEKVTLRRLQSSSAAEVDDSDEEAEKVEGEVVDDDMDYSSMSKDQLIALCVKKGLKVAKHQKPKQYYIDALSAADESADEEEGPKKSSSKEQEADDDEYSNKTAKELFEMCKSRGIKGIKPRQSSKVYIKALKAYVAAADESEDDGDDWGDEEEAPKNTEKKTTGKSNKKAASVEAEEEEDDGDDWEI